jgi:hypothetical protein
MYKFIPHISNKEELSQQWMDSVTVPIYKE